MNNDLNSTVVEEIKSFSLSSWLKAVLINPSDIELQNKIINSNNTYACNQLEPLFYKDIGTGELHPKVTSSTRLLLNLPDSSYVAKNAADYGMALEEIDSLLLSKDIQNDHSRVFVLLIYFLAQKHHEISFAQFERSVFTIPLSMETNKFKKNLGNIKQYREALERYKKVSHFILARNHLGFCVEVAEVSKTMTKNKSLTTDLEFFFRLSKYFHNKLLKLQNKHSKNKQYFLQEDFIKIPKELLSPSLYQILEQEFNDKELKLFDSIFEDMWFNIKNRLNLTLDF